MAVAFARQKRSVTQARFRKSRPKLGTVFTNYNLHRRLIEKVLKCRIRLILNEKQLIVEKVLYFHLDNKAQRVAGGRRESNVYMGYSNTTLCDGLVAFVPRRGTGSLGGLTVIASQLVV